MSEVTISNAVKYVGVDDKTIDLFESQYHVPNGVSYNSYVILDEKIAVMDTVDARKTEVWLNNLEKVFQDREPDYLVISHMEPDHAGSLAVLAHKYPKMKLIGNAKTFPMLQSFFPMNLEGRTMVVKEGDSISLGAHHLTFVMSPMVHWPEVMVTYESSEKILFSADGFGKFGALDTNESWVDEARRYYLNIVGKYGANVQALLKKASTLDIQMICPLHGPVLKENLGYYLEKYDIWSSYRPEEDGVLVAYASIHGNTRRAALRMAEILKEKGAKQVVVADLARDDMAQAVADAFRFDKLFLAAPTYDGGLFPPMEEYLHHLRSKAFQKRKVAVMENGSWGPLAAKKMLEQVQTWKEMKIVEQTITIRSAMTPENEEQMKQVAEILLAEQ